MEREPLSGGPPPAEDVASASESRCIACRAVAYPLTGLEVRFGASTIQRWYYAARTATNTLEVLHNQIRSDIGSFPSISHKAAEALREQYAQHPSWNVKLLHDNLGVVLAAPDPPVPCPSYPSVRRYLKAHGLTRKRPQRRGADPRPSAPARQ